MRGAAICSSQQWQVHVPVILPSGDVAPDHLEQGPVQPLHLPIGGSMVGGGASFRYLQQAAHLTKPTRFQNSFLDPCGWTRVHQNGQ